MNTTSNQNLPFEKPYATVSAAIAALDQVQLDRLTAIARRRIQRLTHSSTVQRLEDPADYAHSAIMLVLVGELHPGDGRQTHPRHLKNQRSFFNFLQGVISSLVCGSLKKLDTQGESVSIELFSARGGTQDVQLNEIKTALLARLRAYAGDNLGLQSALQSLELEVKHPSQQPSRKQLHKMRLFSREVLQQMAGQEGINQMLLS